MKGQGFIVAALVFTTACAGTGSGGNMKETLRSRLTPIQYQVTQECGTEPPFRNEFWDNKREGLYVDIVSGEPLFSSRDKYDSGTGWPSFSRPFEPGNLSERTDRTLGTERIEVRSRKADSHLGHVFPDGPAPTGLRYCINSAALRFIPVEDLGEEGYGDYSPLFEGKKGQSQTAFLGAGCFWGVEHILNRIPGVLSTETGFMGGRTASPTYRDVCEGDTGHVEVVKVVFDPDRLPYASLLDHFWRLHDPTTPDRQGPDVGEQYKSVIFTTSAEQREQAETSRNRFNASNSFGTGAVTEIRPAGPFTRAEEYHQDYYSRKGGMPYCHILRDTY